MRMRKFVSMMLCGALAVHSVSFGAVSAYAEEIFEEGVVEYPEEAVEITVEEPAWEQPEEFIVEEYVEEIVLDEPSEDTAEAVEEAAVEILDVSPESTVETVEAERETEAEPSQLVLELLENMTLQEKIEQMLCVSYRVWEEVPDTEIIMEDSEGSDGQDDAANTAASGTADAAQEEYPKVNVTQMREEIRQDLEDHSYGGVLLFAENFQDAEQVVRLTADLQQASLDGGGLPLLIAADQEGGNVARVTFGTTGTGNMALAATGNPENARTMASIYGEELRLLGLNTDFAPVLDINNNPANPVIGVRSFSDDPVLVTQYGRSYMEGLADAGVIATLKHFPGHGNTDTDSHTGFPCINSSYEELKEFELIPFQNAIDAGAEMIMTAHIQYPQIETGTYTSVSSGEEVYLPATMSHTILTDILRGDMGYGGVIVSDALDMAAIAENFAPEDVLRMTINAGVDFLVLPPVSDHAGFEKLQDMVELAVRLAEEGKIDAQMIDASVSRILSLKEKYGILTRTDFTVTQEQVSAALEGVGSDANREQAYEIAQQALTLVKNDGDAFPVYAGDGESILLLFSDSCASRVGAGQLAEQVLRVEGALPGGTEIKFIVNNAENGEDCMRAAKEADHVILIHRTYGLSNLDPNADDGFSSAVFDRVIEECHSDGKQVVLISCQLPYDAARFSAADAILLTYNSSPMTEVPPMSGAGSAFAPNLIAGICAALGDGGAGGTVPVVIPELDENYQPK